MATKNKSISILSRVVLGVFLVGVPATAAFAAGPEVPTAESAEGMAQHFREQAEQYRSLGGVGYKAGLVQRAEADAAKYGALAEQLRGPVVAAPARSPEAEHYAQLAARYRAMGGAAYKSGLVQWAEAQEKKYESIGSAASMTATPCLATEPVVRMVSCSK